MKKKIHRLFFISLVVLFNTCESPEEPDIIPPIINITYPNIDEIINEIITITTEVSDNDKIAAVWFAINDSIKNDAKVISPPWEYELNTSGYPENSQLTIRAVAKDNADNKTISDIVTVTIDNSTSYPNIPTITSIEYDLTSMTIIWEESSDLDFSSYILYQSEDSNDFLDALVSTEITTKSETSYSLSIFNPTIQNWFWIQVQDSAGLKALSLGKTSNIDLPPSQINNFTIFYVNDGNENNQVLNIAWLQSNDADFNNYNLKHRLDYTESNNPDSWDEIWSSDSINHTFYQSNENQFEPSDDDIIINWFKMTVTDQWGQSTSSPEFNDADSDGPPPSSNIISVEYNLDLITVIWEDTQEDLIEFDSYILYHSNSETGIKNHIFSTEDDVCRKLDLDGDNILGEEEDCINTCFWDNEEKICHNNSISNTSWIYSYEQGDTNYLPNNENWFWIEVVDQRGAKTIGEGLSNNIELFPESINITSLNSDIISNNEVTINITWEQSNAIDFKYYTLYQSEYNWASSDSIKSFNNININLYNESILIDQTVDNWFWVTVTDIWNLESSIGSGMMILSDPMPEAVNVDSVIYDISKMTIFWNQSGDDTFESYQVYKSDSEYGEYDLLNNSTITNRTITEFIIDNPNFDPTIENWFKIKTIDNLGQDSFGSSKSNTIDLLPLDPVLHTIEYNNQIFSIEWEENSDDDFKNYSLYKSYNQDMSNSSLLQNITNSSITLFTWPISDDELEYGDGLLFFQLSVADYWDQLSYGNIEVGSNHEKFIKNYGSENYDFIFSVITNNNGYTASGILDNKIWILQTDLSGLIDKEIEIDFNSFQGVGESDKSMVSTSDGGYILTGHTRHLGSDMDAFLIKLDPDLNTAWSKFYCAHCQNNDPLDELDNSRNDRGVSVIETSDGGYIFTGSHHDLNAGGIFYIWVLKTDSNGEIVWNSGVSPGFSLPYSSLYDNTGYSIIETLDQHYIIIGNVDNSSTSTDLWISKLSSNGNGLGQADKIWEYYYGGISIDEAYTIIEISNGYIIAGTTRSMGNGGYDGWVLKIDASGNVDWQKTYGGTFDDKIHSVVQSEDGLKLTYCGYTRSYDSQNDDIWIFQTDLEGNEIFNKTIGGALVDKAYGIKNTLDDGFIISGISQSTQGNYGNLEAILIKTDPQGNTDSFE